MKPPHTFRKDRHSKILTAQGPRDRRVRLSIQVARRFFDLHDTLGFDKASKTLDWLLTNSQPAIDDLVKNKRSSCAAVDEGCSRSDTTEAAEMRDKHYMMKNTTSIDNTQDQRVSMQLEEKAKMAALLARESRAKARARARERTRQKMCVRQLLGTNKLLPHDFRIAANHLSTWNELSYLHKIGCRAPYFSVGTDQVGQRRNPELLSETNTQTSVRSFEAYDKKFDTPQVK
ncbi:hypothetical protein ACET3Z_011161 [Daucus carota]